MSKRFYLYVDYTVYLVESEAPIPAGEGARAQAGAEAIDRVELASSRPESIHIREL